MQPPSHPDYYALTPDQILDAVEHQGWRCDGRLLALNSYENRVYQVGIEDAAPVVVKFYRPERWDDDAILEEHAFAAELVEAEIPVVAPMRDAEGATLQRAGSFRFAVFPRCGGRAPELDNLDHLEQLGRFLGRMHAVAANRPFVHRPTLTVESFGESSCRFLLEAGFIPADLEHAYRTLAVDVLRHVRWCFERAGDVRSIRLHGDFHAGNILWSDAGPHLVDLDDARMGPAVQDLWMCLSGDRGGRTIVLDALLEGYTLFADFDPLELHLVEALRTLRMMHYHAWLARRWDDPAFPRAFPWFNNQRCWEQHILDLREQVALMQEPPLAWMGAA
jgi:Ser/Thr protein kinase RdoA (MazF antagonist)